MNLKNQYTEETGCDPYVIVNGHDSWPSGGYVDWLENKLIKPFDPLADVMNQHAKRIMNKILEQREEILAAFVAKHGFEPDEAEQVIERVDNSLQTKWFVRKRLSDPFGTEKENAIKTTIESLKKVEFKKELPVKNVISADTISFILECLMPLNPEQVEKLVRHLVRK